MCWNAENDALGQCPMQDEHESFPLHSNAPSSSLRSCAGMHLWRRRTMWASFMAPSILMGFRRGRMAGGGEMAQPWSGQIWFGAL